jgi:hypothetical protein
MFMRVRMVRMCVMGIMPIMLYSLRLVMGSRRCLDQQHIAGIAND